MKTKIDELDKEVAEREATGRSNPFAILMPGNDFPRCLFSFTWSNMSLSRRQFIQASGLHSAGAIPLRANAAGQQPPLPIPPLIESRRGQPLFLTLQRAHWSFATGTRAGLGG
jgi:hypothetical protein